jgi:hypothetical protein
MNGIGQHPQSVSEALQDAHECWSTYYGEAQCALSKNLLIRNQQRSVFGNVIWGAGSTIALFPNTHYEPDDFRFWYESMDDAWNHDWFNVGADFYEALSKAQVELINVRSAERESTISAIR